MWGESAPTEEQADHAYRAFVANFPDCAGAVRGSLECAKEHHTCESDVCKDVNNRLQFCIWFSYCPKQAELFADCVKSYNKPVEVQKFPRGCQRYFNALDKCMSSHTVNESVTQQE